VDVIESDFARHCRSARKLAAECFEAARAIGSLMERPGARLIGALQPARLNVAWSCAGLFMDSPCRRNQKHAPELRTGRLATGEVAETVALPAGGTLLQD
jgi:hypothetical protein